MTLRTALALGILVALPGCGGVATPGPRATLESARMAAARHDADALYALLPDSARRTETLAAFRARMAASPAELDALAANIHRATDEGHQPVAEIPAAHGSVVTVDDREGWRVGQAGFGPAVTLTPADTLRALRQALLRQSLPEILALMSSSTRGAVQAEINALVDALAEPSALPRSSSGPANAPGNVDFTLPDGRRVRLRREGDVYRVDGIDAAP